MFVNTSIKDRETIIKLVKESKIEIFNCIEALCAIRLNKPFIIEAQTTYKNKESSYYKNPEISRIRINGKLFYLNDGVCENGNLNYLEVDLRWHLAAQFIYANNDPYTVVYPINGIDEFKESREEKTLWLNEKRWDYVDFCIALLQNLVSFSESVK